MDISENTKGEPFEAPRLILHGTVADLTNASYGGVIADQTIPAGASVLGKTSL